MRVCDDRSVSSYDAGRSTRLESIRGEDLVASVDGEGLMTVRMERSRHQASVGNEGLLGMTPVKSCERRRENVPSDGLGKNAWDEIVRTEGLSMMFFRREQISGNR